MRKALIITIEEIRVPKYGLLDGVWYSGRQYWKGRFGNIKEIVDDNFGRTYAHKMSKKELAGLSEALRNGEIFIKK